MGFLKAALGMADGGQASATSSVLPTVGDQSRVQVEGVHAVQIPPCNLNFNFMQVAHEKDQSPIW